MSRSVQPCARQRILECGWRRGELPLLLWPKKTPSWKRTRKKEQITRNRRQHYVRVCAFFDFAKVSDEPRDRCGGRRATTDDNTIVYLKTRPPPLPPPPSRCILFIFYKLHARVNNIMRFRNRTARNRIPRKPCVRGRLLRRNTRTLRTPGIWSLARPRKSLVVCARTWDHVGSHIIQRPTSLRPIIIDRI